MKKLISSLLAFVLAFSTVATVTFAKTEPLVTLEEYQETLVKGLNLVSEKLSTKEKITRADFALVLMGLINEPVSASGTTSYSDVTGASKETAAIEKARNMGLMVGVGENLFAPTQPILYSQAVKIILRATKNVREFNGEEIITGENYERLTKGIGYSDTRELDYPTLVKLIYNALSVTVLEASFDLVGTMSASVNAFETLPEYFFDYKRVGGILYADAYSSILSTSGNGSTVTIGNSDYKSTADYNDLLGFKVDGFVDEDKNVVCIAADEDNAVLKLNSKNAVYSSRVYTYDNGGSYKQINLESGIPVAYNDRAMTSYDETKMLPQDGYAMLIDNNDDNEIDVVRVVEYININVQGITTKENRTEIYDGEKGIIATLIAESDADTTIIMDSEGNAKEIKNIRAGVVASVIGEAFTNAVTGDVESVVARRVILSNKTIEGAVDLIDTDEKALTINGEVYSYDSYYNSNVIGFGRSYVFMLDFMGNIAGSSVKDSDDIPVALAYIIETSLDAEGVCTIKVVTPYDKIVKYKCAPKVKIEGQLGRISNHATLLDNVNDSMRSAGNLIGYTVDEERRIDKILFATMDYATGGRLEGPSNIPSNFGLYGTTRTSGDGAMKWYAYFNTFFGKVTIDDSTIIFAVPEDVNIATATEEEYRAIRKSDLVQSDAKKYDVQGYVFGKDSEYADVIVVKTSVTPTVSEDSRISVIKDFKQGINEDDEVIYEVTVIQNPNSSAEEKTYLASDAVISSSGKLQGVKNNGTSETRDIAVGDVVALATDALGEISAIKVISTDKDTLYDNNIGDYVGNIEKINGIGRRLIQAGVYSVNSKYVTLVKKDINPKNAKWSEMEQITLDRCAIVVVEKDAGKTMVREGTIADIDGYKEKGKSSNVLMNLSGYISYMLVIYK